MFSLLETILTAIVVVFVLYFLIKYPNARLYVFTFLGICATALTVYSAINLNYYYNAKGGIFGYISGIFDTNITEVDNLEFSLKNIEMLKLEEDGDTYVAKIYTSETISKLSVGEEYNVYINGVPCSKVESASDYVLAEYDYSFYNDQFNEVLRDTLEIRFVFNNLNTYIQVSTNGGEDAVKLWNSYFHKNDCKILIATSEYVGGESIYVEGDIDTNSIKKVQYFVDGELVKIQYYTTGTSLKLHDCEIEDFYCWSLDSQSCQVISANYIVNSDINLYAYYTEDCFLTLSADNSSIYFNESKTCCYVLFQINEDQLDNLSLENITGTIDVVQMVSISTSGATFAECSYDFKTGPGIEQVNSSDILHFAFIYDANLFRYWRNQYNNPFTLDYGYPDSIKIHFNKVNNGVLMCLDCVGLYMRDMEIYSLFTEYEIEPGYYKNYGYMEGYSTMFIKNINIQIPKITNIGGQQ